MALAGIALIALLIGSDFIPTSRSGDETSMSRRNLLSAVVLLVALSGSVAAQGTQLSPEARQAILDFKLTMPRAEHLIVAIEEMTKYVVSLPDYQERMRKSRSLTPAEQASQMEKDPKSAAILKAHGLTGRDYLVGVPALRMAVLAAQGVATPNIIASDANVAFAKANLAQLKAKMDAADGIRR
jgi:hypothetical protein